MAVSYIFGISWDTIAHIEDIVNASSGANEPTDIHARIGKAVYELCCGTSLEETETGEMEKENSSLTIGSFTDNVYLVGEFDSVDPQVFFWNGSLRRLSSLATDELLEAKRIVENQMKQRTTGDS
ncbi:MAG: hypothetical protein H8D67_25650 [Deltaproteobacteria bacterium]|nr:hypothetical protein [Deltaproteobacteria bacterium]MBL7186547.1 hypothetical protein [Phycisphaerae bacterium]